MSDKWMDGGGPAFPVNAGGATYKGMSLRDYFAGQALAGMLANPEQVEDSFSTELATDAYHVADAMLKAREVVK